MLIKINDLKTSTLKLGQVIKIPKNKNAKIAGIKEQTEIQEIANVAASILTGFDKMKNNRELSRHAKK